MSDTVRTRQTFRRELWRSASSGILETAGSTFLLLIAVKWFQAGANAKSLLAAGGSLGLLLTPVTVTVVLRWGWPPARAASRLFALGAIACAVMVAFPSEAVFVIAGILAMMTTSACIPLMTQIYQDNYPTERRGQLYSRTFMVRIAATVLFGWVAGWWLTEHLAWYRVLLAAYGGAFIVASVALAGIPSLPLRGNVLAHPLHALSLVAEDRLFRQALYAWMLMGFANLMMLPMRVEYLANPRFGLGRPSDEIALLTVVIPNLARLGLSPIWGWVFDRMNFFSLRVILNVGFALGILTFFTSTSRTGLIVAAVVFGISNAGGDVAWGLWVTKLAPSGRVADYMSVHTFLTGVRGVVAPFAAFHAVSRFSLGTLGGFSAMLILGASLLLLPEIARLKGGKTPLVVPDNDPS